MDHHMKWLTQRPFQMSIKENPESASIITMYHILPNRYYGQQMEEMLESMHQV